MGRTTAQAMEEALRRRLSHVGEANGDESFGTLPDLILFGRRCRTCFRHPAAASDSLGVSVPVFGMVKDEHHKTRTISFGGWRSQHRQGTGGVPVYISHSGGGAPVHHFPDECGEGKNYEAVLFGKGSRNWSGEGEKVIAAVQDIDCLAGGCF